MDIAIPELRGWSDIKREETGTEEQQWQLAAAKNKTLKKGRGKERGEGKGTPQQAWRKEPGEILKLRPMTPCQSQVTLDHKVDRDIIWWAYIF